MFLNKNIWYEGEGEGESSEGENTSETQTISTTPITDAEKKFSQTDINRFLAEEKRKAQKAQEKTIKQLEELKKSQSLTEEEKVRWEERIEVMKNEFLTKEELAKKQAKAERDKQKAEAEAREKETAKWKRLYEEKTTEVGIAVAASDPDVYNPQQIVDILTPKTRLVEEMDSETGQPTGRFTTKTRIMGKNQEGKEVIFELTPSEAVRLMKDQPEKWGNLFRTVATGGLGGNNLANRNRGDDTQAPTDPRQFREWRKKNPDYQVKY